MLATNIGKHDTHIADLLIRVNALESDQQKHVLEKIENVRCLLRDDLCTSNTEFQHTFRKNLKLIETVLQSIQLNQNKLMMDVTALKAVENHEEMKREILDLKQMVGILKRTRKQAELRSTALSVPSVEENAAIVHLRSANQGDMESPLKTRVKELEGKIEILNLMHRNLRSELANMNLVDTA